MGPGIWLPFSYSRCVDYDDIKLDYKVTVYYDVIARISLLGMIFIGVHWAELMLENFYMKLTQMTPTNYVSGIFLYFTTH